jgi:hypothetical protein
VAPIAITFGALLTALGGVLLILAEKKSATAFIPGYVGIALIVLGLVARNDKARMHAMHIAALLAALGLVGGVVMGILSFVRDRPATVWGGSFGMAVLCGAFLGLCVQSFIAARRARRQNNPSQ